MKITTQQHEATSHKANHSSSLQPHRSPSPFRKCRVVPFRAVPFRAVPCRAVLRSYLALRTRLFPSFSSNERALVPDVWHAFQTASELGIWKSIGIKFEILIIFGAFPIQSDS